MNNAKIGFMRKTNLDGSENPKYVDVLDEDKAVSGQKFVCVSFISPEKILKQKNLFSNKKAKTKSIFKTGKQKKWL